MYYNESLFESVSILSVMTSVWTASIYQLCKKYGTTYRRQYYLGIIEWLVDLIILDARIKIGHTEWRFDL